MNALSMPSRDRVARWAVNGSLLLMALMLGGSLYERLVVDAAWPTNMILIQPDQGGVNRKVFWIPLHVGLTLLLPAALWGCWPRRAARRRLLVAIGIYVAIRVWSAVYFIPLALQFESAKEFTDALVREAQRWVHLSFIRTPMTVAAVVALWLASRRLDATTTRGAA